MNFKNDLAKYKPRKEQKDTIDFIDSVYKSNPLSKVFLLNLPTGVGKSYLAFMIVDWYHKNVNKNSKVDIITNSKLLQNQYTDSYESMNDLKGKENYSCKQYACSCMQGAEFNRLNKTSCDSCPHSHAREMYITGGISLTNFYLYILYALYNPKVLDTRESNVLIVDECHELSEVMSDFISIKITETFLRKYKFPNETRLVAELKKIITIDDYIDFLNILKEEIDMTIIGMESAMLSTPRSIKGDKRDLKISKLTNTINSDVKIMNNITDLKQYLTKIDIFLKEYKLNSNNWVLESQYNEKTKQKELSLEPIWADEYLEKYIFSRYDMVFMMSGTILDKNLFCKINGLDVTKTEYYSIDSPFNPKNRPVIYMPLGKMSYKQKEETFKVYIPYIKKILEKYKNKKGIIHTNSFELSNWIQENIKDPRLVFHDSSNKDDVLKAHQDTEDPTVIVSPSMNVGVSFDNEYARFQIVAKVPYPSLASQKNKVRMKNNPDWYAWKTCCDLIQTFGRIVRSNLDFGDTIVIDGSFSDVIRHSSHYIPEWIQKSVKKVNVK
jgi:Rad3-related DNA helicase